MSTARDEKQLKPCLTKIIELVDEYLLKFKQFTEQPQPKTDTKQDNLLQNAQLNNNVYTFPLSNQENELLDTLTSDIKTILDQHLPHLSSICLYYLLDFLHKYQYDTERREFTSPLAMGVLHSFHRELEGLLASAEAFPAAFNGDLQTVRQFIKDYPTYKDKPGLWQTTLLYSAARNNHLDIMKYLIERLHCSVNAQNQHDVDFALNVDGAGFTANPTAASTALHAACYNGHLNIVKYLVEHGADYFIQNQANETPIINGEFSDDIKEYFQNYLIISYSDETLEHLPERTIMKDDRRPIEDCMWEYKPFQDPKWYKFTAAEATELYKALSPKEEFQPEVHLRVSRGLYSISMIEFYRSGRHGQDPQKNMAWIRCRGSSILNFDCYSIWQIMLIQHQKVDKNAETTASLKPGHFPTMSDSRFKLHLNTWYNCDAKTNSLLDDSMNYRRKVISIDIPFVGDDLKFNLQAFEFSNDEKTILGDIRWIPKLISNTDNNNGKIVHVDNYHIMANIQPIPLTVKRMEELSPVKKASQQEANDVVNEEDDDDDKGGLEIATTSALENDNEADNENIGNSNNKNKATSENNGTWALTDLNDEMTDSKHYNKPSPTSTSNTTVNENPSVSAEQFFNQ